MPNNRTLHLLAILVAILPWLVIGIVIFFSLPAHPREQYPGQMLAVDPHHHGSGRIPDWYDSDCCHQRDCAPVDDSTIQFGMSTEGKPVVIYTEGSAGDSKTFVYEKERWRWSKDERYHACRRGLSPLCIYIRPGV